MSPAPHDDSVSVTLGIMRDIVTEVARRGVKVSDHLAGCLLKSVYQNPDNGFSSDRPLDRDDIRRLVGTCTERLLHDHKPLLETIRMQAAWLAHYGTGEDVISDHRHQLDTKLASLTRMVVEDNARTKQGLDSLYRRMVTLVVLRSGLGNPTDPSVVAEANTCLATVFPVSQLVAFQGMVRIEKKTKIRQLTAVVKGLRIYNWDCGRGGAGVDHLPSILNSAAEATSSNLKSLAQHSREKVYKLTSAFEKLIYTEAGKDAAPKDIDQLRWGITNCRQFLRYLDQILRDVDASSERISHLDQRLLSQLAQLQSTIGDSAQPWASVSPMFTNLAATWTGLQDEMVVLSNLTSLSQSLHSHTKCLSKLPMSRLSAALEPLTVTTDEQRQELTSRLELDQTKLVTEVIYPGTVARYDTIPLEFAGYCPIALLSGAGLLLPGNARLGTLRWRGRYYVCSTVDRAEQFGVEPDLYISAVAGLVTRHTVLEQILMSSSGEAQDGPIESGDVKTDASSQTETHPLSSVINPDYKWNEWDMRREALNVCNMSDKVSHGNQVGLSLGSRNFSVQTAGESKESGCQTQTSAECDDPATIATSMEPEAKSLKVQVRTKTPTGIQIETMDIDKLFENA